MFDITATSNHWVVNPRHNLGLQLSVETLDGESLAKATTSPGQPCLGISGGFSSMHAHFHLSRLSPPFQPGLHASLFGSKLKAAPFPCMGRV